MSQDQLLRLATPIKCETHNMLKPSSKGGEVWLVPMNVCSYQYMADDCCSKVSLVNGDEFLIKGDIMRFYISDEPVKAEVIKKPTKKKAKKVASK